jgi:hypothetical protein
MMRLTGVSTARRKRLKPPYSVIVRNWSSVAWAPRAQPPACERADGVQMSVEAE